MIIPRQKDIKRYRQRYLIKEGILRENNKVKTRITSDNKIEKEYTIGQFVKELGI